MQPVKSPEKDYDYDERAVHCREALEGKVQQLIEESVRAGWSRTEVGAALQSILEETNALMAKLEEG